MIRFPYNNKTSRHERISAFFAERRCDFLRQR